MFDWPNAASVRILLLTLLSSVVGVAVAIASEQGLSKLEDLNAQITETEIKLQSLRENQTERSIFNTIQRLQQMMQQHSAR